MHETQSRRESCIFSFNQSNSNNNNNNNNFIQVSYVFSTVVLIWDTINK